MGIDLQPGKYTGKPTCWGFTTTKNGYEQFAIEFAIEVHDADGVVSVVHATKFGGMEGEGFEYTVQNLRTCGWTGTDFNDVQLDTTKAVRLIVEDKGTGYGAEIKSVYPLDSGGGVLIKKQAMAEDKKRELAARLNARLAQLPATPGAATPKPNAGARPAGKTDDIPF